MEYWCVTCFSAAAKAAQAFFMGTQTTLGAQVALVKGAPAHTATVKIITQTVKKYKCTITAELIKTKVSKLHVEELHKGSVTCRSCRHILSIVNLGGGFQLLVTSHFLLHHHDVNLCSWVWNVLTMTGWIASCHGFKSRMFHLRRFRTKSNTFYQS